MAGGSLTPGGEFSGDEFFLASAELFDPASGSWTATASMGTPRAGHTAMLLPDGTVLVIDGMNDSAVSFELYDPGSGN